MITLAEANAEVRALLAEATALYWTDTQINSWLNQGCQDVARRAEVLWKVGTVPVNTLQQDYWFPLDVLRIRKVEFAPQTSAFVYPLTFLGIIEMDSIWGVYQSFPAAWPEQYTIIGGSGFPGAVEAKIRLFPVPAQPGVLNIHYYRTTTNALNSGDPIDCLPGWENVVYDYAAFKAKQADKDQEWREFKQIYETELENLIEMTREFTDQANQVSSGQATWPPWAYGDSDWY